MMVEFIPDLKVAVQNIPFFEDVKADDAPGYSTRKSTKALQSEVSEMLAKLGAGAVVFVPGEYPGVPKRYGYQLRFNLNGIGGRIDVAALPMRTETAKKKEAAMAQALFLTRDWLRAEYYSSLYRPGAFPLMPYLIGEGGKTVTEFMVENRRLPMLGSGN